MPRSLAPFLSAFALGFILLALGLPETHAQSPRGQQAPTHQRTAPSPGAQSAPLTARRGPFAVACRAAAASPTQGQNLGGGDAAPLRPAGPKSLARSCGGPRANSLSGGVYLCNPFPKKEACPLARREAPGDRARLARWLSLSGVDLYAPSALPINSPTPPCAYVLPSYAPSCRPSLS